MLLATEVARMATIQYVVRHGLSFSQSWIGWANLWRRPLPDAVEGYRQGRQRRMGR